MSKFNFLWAILFAFILVGCDAGSGFSSGSHKNLFNATVSGYGEDDPLANATVSISNTNGKVLETATTDANGFYSLKTTLDRGIVYYVKIVGTLSDKNVTMHSVLNFDGNNSSININPLTELKYRLVKDDGKSIEEAENLIREYFNISNGRSLENNRFSTSDTVYRGMKNIAELYNGILPIDAIAKIEDDIVTNASLDANATKNFSFRTLVKKEIKLSTSSTSLPLGETATVSVSGVEELNKNYTIKWTGLPDDINGSDISKTFTVNDFAQDVSIGASLYRADGNRSSLVSSAFTTINFYKELIEQNLTITDSSVDNNFTAGESLSVTIPAGTVNNGQTIKIVQQQTNSDTSLAQFSIDNGSATDGNITFNYSYDPYLVSDPRSLQITMKSGEDLQVINVSEIDYINHVIKFDIPLNTTINRDARFHGRYVIIEQVYREPTNEEITSLLTGYDVFFKKILETVHSEKDFDALYGNDNNSLAKFFTVLKEKDPRFNNDYKFNILANAINILVAKDNLESYIRTYNDKDLLSLYIKSTIMDQKEINSKQNELSPLTTIFSGDCKLTGVDGGDWDRCNTLKDEINTLQSQQWIDKLSYNGATASQNAVLSAWLGKTKITSSQRNQLQYAKTAINLIAGIASGTSEAGFALSVSNEVLGYVNSAGLNNDYLASDEFGYTKGFYDGLAADFDNGKVEFWKGLGTSYVINVLFKELENITSLENDYKTAPIMLSLKDVYQNDNNFLNYTNTSSTSFSALPYMKNDFMDKLFPDPGNYVATGILAAQNEFYTKYRDLISAAPLLHLDGDNYESQLSSTLDPVKKMESLFLTKYSTSATKRIIPDSQRGYVFMALKALIGDEVAKNDFQKLVNASYGIASQIIVQALEHDNLYVEEKVQMPTQVYMNGAIRTIGYHEVVKVKNAPSTWQEFKIWLNRSIRSEASTIDLQDIPNIEFFGTLMQSAKLKLTNTQLQALNITKIKVETYGVGLEYSNSDNAWTLNQSEKVHDTFEATQDINSLFTYDSTLDKNVLSFATLFSNENFTQFDNKLVGLKITLVFEKDGRDKVLSSDFVFITLADTTHTVETNFTGATLKSSVKDAVTGDPIEGAFITLNPGGLSSFTDANGNYEVSGLAAGDYTIVISKEGYGQIESVLTLTEDETKVYEASLGVDDAHAFTNGSVTVTVKDAFNAQTITNDYLKVRNGQNNKTGEVLQTVNNDGNNSLQVTLFPGVYTIETGANGYTKAYATISVIGDTNVDKTISISPVLAENQTRIVLSWSDTPNDLDSHLVKKVAGNQVYHVYYGDSHPSNADASLDVDITSGRGPETITINNLDNSAIYKYYVHDFSNGSNHDDTQLKASGVKVDVYYGNQSKTFYVPNENGNAWKVFEIVNGEIIPCTNGCVFGVDGENDSQLGSRDLRDSQDKTLFENLPSK